MNKNIAGILYCQKGQRQSGPHLKMLPSLSEKLSIFRYKLRISENFFNY